MAGRPPAPRKPDAAPPAGPAAKPADALVFLRSVATHAPRPVYVLTGDEGFFKHRVLDALRTRLLGADAPAAQVRTRSGHKTPGEPALTLGALLDELRAPSLFEPTRLVRIEEAAALLTGEVEPLLAWLAAPTAGVHLVLEVEGLDGRTRVAKALASRGTVIECRRPFDHPPPWQPDAEPWDHPLAAWVTVEAREVGLVCDKPTAHALTQRVGGEPGLLAQELARLATVLGATPSGRKPLTAADVAALVVDSRGEDLFRLADAVQRREAATALKVCDALFRDGVPQQRGDRVRDAGVAATRMVGWIHRTLRDLWVARTLLDRRADGNEMARTLGKKPMFAEAIARDAGRWRTAEFPPLWPRLLAADLALKSGAPARLTVEALVIAACGSGGPPRRR